MEAAAAPGVTGLVGRAAEAGRIDALLAAARAGEGGALLLRGEAGIGKSALLGHASAADGVRVLRASGAEYESELPFAALHALCVPLLGGLAELPDPYREALEGAFGLGGGTPDVFRAGLAALELLAAGAREAPLLCVVDDAHWLDSASSRAIAFLARRITAEPVALLLAARPGSAAAELDALPVLDVGGLRDGEARALLANSRLTLDEQVRDRLVAEARGNPLALLELPGDGGFAPPDPTPVTARLERGYAARLAGLPPGARLLLTLASADPTGDPALLWPAAGTLGLDPRADAAAAAGTGLAEFGTRIAFCHPLARSAVHRAAGDADRRAAHRALAAATGPADADRRAWHRALATAGPDDDVADELERSASRARTRGGAAAAAAFLERSAALTLDPARRVERTFSSVRARLEAGAADAAAALLGTVDDAALDGAGRATADLLRGRIAFLRPGDDRGAEHMVRAATRLTGTDPGRARECLLDALETALVVGRAAGVADRVLAAAADVPAPSGPDALDVLALLTAGDHRTAIPLLRELAVAGLSARWPATASMLASELWDPDLHGEIAESLVRAGRRTGSPPRLRLGLAQVASGAALRGDLGRATAAIAEEEAIADAVGGPPILYHRLHLAALRGHRRAALELFEEAAARDPGQLAGNVHWAAAVLHNGLAEHPAALAAARAVTASGDLFLAGFALPELVEAAVRCGEQDEAAAALAALTVRTEAAGTPTARGIAASARALVTGAEDDYRQATELLATGPLLPYRGRAHLLYGEWLRRAGRRRDCRTELTAAHALFADAGLDAFAARAARELRASGEKASRRPAPGGDVLTAQETAVARLVATGATSNDVAARLFLSPRTVDAHLRNIFRKLGISSRRQLRDRPELVRG